MFSQKHELIYYLHVSASCNAWVIITQNISMPI